MRDRIAHVNLKLQQNISWLINQNRKSCISLQLFLVLWCIFSRRHTLISFV